jgi:hypothetical protein
MAGAEAEVEFFGACSGGDEQDRTQINRLKEEVFGEVDVAKFHRREAQLRAITRKLVRRHRSLIECVAGELLKRRTLSGDELKAIVGSRMPMSKPVKPKAVRPRMLRPEDHSPVGG